MMVKPIKNRHGHAAAKEKLKELMLLEPTQAIADEIEVLVAVMEKYEREAILVEAPTPVAAIRLRMEQNDLTPRALEPYIGSRARVSEVLSGKRNLTVEMIRALHEGLNIPYESLMQKTERDSTDPLEVSPPVLNRLKKAGLKLKAGNIESFLKDAFGSQFVPALPRKTRSQRASAKTDDKALLIWQAAVLTMAMKKLPDGEFEHQSVDAEFLRSVAQLSQFDDGPLRAIELLSEHGIVVVILSQLPGTYLDGAIMLLHGKSPVIGLTLRHDRVDNFWFTLLHELAHLVKHFEALKSSNHAFFDDLEFDSDDAKEREADELAKLSLIPERFVHGTFKNRYASNDDMKRVSGSAGVHISIAAGRWQKENSNYKKFSRLIMRNTLKSMLAAV